MYVSTDICTLIYILICTQTHICVFVCPKSDLVTNQTCSKAFWQPRNASRLLAKKKKEKKKDNKGVLFYILFLWSSLKNHVTQDVLSSYLFIYLFINLL